jgi:hypothetical protein
VSGIVQTCDGCGGLICPGCCACDERLIDEFLQRTSEPVERVSFAQLAAERDRYRAWYEDELRIGKERDAEVERLKGLLASAAYERDALRGGGEVEYLKGKCAALDARRGEYQAEVELMKSQLLDVKVPYEHAQRLAEEVERLRAALKRYGQHESSCDWYSWGPVVDTSTTSLHRPCTCGLDAALAGGEP